MRPCVWRGHGTGVGHGHGAARTAFSTGTRRASSGRRVLGELPRRVALKSLSEQQRERRLLLLLLLRLLLRLLLLLL